MNLAFIQNLGWPELVVILVVVVLVFGVKKIPDIARALGRSSGEFKRGIQEGNKIAADKAKDIETSLKDSESEKSE